MTNLELPISRERTKYSTIRSLPYSIYKSEFQVKLNVKKRIFRSYHYSTGAAWQRLLVAYNLSVPTFYRFEAENFSSIHVEGTLTQGLLLQYILNSEKTEIIQVTLSREMDKLVV